MRYYARRHLLDTVGVMIAGAPGDVATNAETMLAGVRGGGNIPVPGRAKRHDLLDAAFLGGTAAHGIELDDGYRVGSAHCGCTVVPAALSVGYERGDQRRAADRGGRRRLRGRDLPRARLRAGPAPARLPSDQRGRPVRRGGRGRQAARPQRAQQIADALGIAASASAGLFAFVNGGADIKRLHAGHASREGMQAALLAELGVQGPPNVIEARDGFMQAFAFGRSDKARAIALPPDAPFGITDCYIKPYACCRHIQPAVEALFGLLNDEKIEADDIKHVDVETYRIAAEHAHTGWDDYASAQLSFPYLMGLAARFRGIKVRSFQRRDAHRSGLRRVRQAPHHHGAARDRRALSEAAPGARHRDDRARQIRAPGRRGARLAHRAARRCRAGGEVHRHWSSRCSARRAPKALVKQLWDIEALADIRPLVDATAQQE